VGEEEERFLAALEMTDRVGRVMSGGWRVKGVPTEGFGLAQQAAPLQREQTGELFVEEEGLGGSGGGGFAAGDADYA
jgi:hypothetical protein